MEYSKTVAATFEGRWKNLARGIFRRMGRAAKVEMVKEQLNAELRRMNDMGGARNLNYEESKQRLNKELKLMRNEDKLSAVSKEVSRMAKKHKGSCDEKHLAAIKLWCKSSPLRNSIKSSWKFLEAIEDMIAVNN